MQLRHALATLAYRAAKPLKDAPPGFAEFQLTPACRTPAQILAHMGDLFDWAILMADGSPAWHDSTPLEWNEEVSRFFAALEKFDQRLTAPISVSEEMLFQGPIADALTHAGQIAMLRRLAGRALPGENYAIADIEAGRVGPEQAEPRYKFGS